MEHLMTGGDNDDGVTDTFIKLCHFRQKKHSRIPFYLPFHSKFPLPIYLRLFYAKHLRIQFTYLLITLSKYLSSATLTKSFPLYALSLLHFHPLPP